MNAISQSAVRKGRQRWQLAGGQWRSFMLFIVIATFVGFFRLGLPVEDFFQLVRIRSHSYPVSGQIVFVAIDDKSQSDVGSWPWPRSTQARLLERLDAAGAKRIAVDLTYDFPSTEADDAALRETLRNHDNIWIGARATSEVGERADPTSRLLPFGDARLAALDVQYDYRNMVFTYNGSYATSRGLMPTLGSVLAGRDGLDENFAINHHFDKDSVPALSASDVLNGNFRPEQLEGKVVLVGVDSAMIGDRFAFPGQNLDAGALIHYLAAETMMSGKPIRLGFLPAIGLAALAIWLGMVLRRPRLAFGLGAAAAIGIVVSAFALDRRGIIVEVLPGLLLLFMSGLTALRRRYRLRGFVNEDSGLANFQALLVRANGDERPLIVARLVNYPQIVAKVGSRGEAELAEQIVARFALATPRDQLFHGEDGLFAWQVGPDVAISSHIDALHALFRAPAKVGETSFDLPVSFGVEIGSSRPIKNRLGSAVAAADEAARQGDKWMCHDPFDARGEFGLSILSELDEAMAKGHVWLAFQPQLDFASGSWRGAEALARWTHPVRGTIMPGDFIRAAEQNNRIDELTLYVFDKAIEAAALINREHGEFTVSVNLSAKTLRRRALPAELDVLLKRHGLDPALLTVELTETAAIASEADGLETLHALRAIGISLSIDDYGTGLSTLDYLKKIPADEIKVDQSFVTDLAADRSDLLLVQSTIALAHALDRTVVAEGIEDADTLALLQDMGCDGGQGFAISRPIDLQTLLRRLNRKGARAVA